MHITAPNDFSKNVSLEREEDGVVLDSEDCCGEEGQESAEHAHVGIVP